MGGAVFISGTGRTTRQSGWEGLGARQEKTDYRPTTDSFVIFEDMPVSPATEKLIGQFKLCAQNGIKDLAINCHVICTRAALARYKLCFNPSKHYFSMTRLTRRR